MDRKSILVLAVCFGLVLALGPISRKLFPNVPAPAQTAAAGAPQISGTNAPGTATAIPSLGAATTARMALSNNAAPADLVVNSGDAQYTFTPRGGGLELVELTQYPRQISRTSRTNPSAGGYVTLNTTIAAPTLAVLGDHSVEGDGIFVLSRTATGIHAEKTLPNGLRITKDFVPGADYLIQTSVRFENTSGQELVLPAQEWVVGTAVPMDADDKGDNVGLMWYDGSRKTEILHSWFSSRGFMCMSSLPRTEYRAGNTNVVWAVAENQYFALAAMPATAGAEVIARPLELPRPSEGDASVTNNPARQGVQTVIIYPGLALAPGQSTTNNLVLYAGPKEYKTLARIAGHMGNNLDLVMGFGSVFGFVSKALLLAMNFIHATSHIDYGWVIIILTLLLRLAFWPLSAASMRTSKAMAALQPEMAKLKEKYKDDPIKMQQKTNELWKENGVHPLNGCLPAAVQIPVFFGLFGMLRTAIELRGAHFLWISDLSKPDTIFTIPGLGIIPFIGTPGVGLHVNVLPILYIATALWQTHVQPPSPGMDPSQQRLMRWMPLMFLAILYNYSSALALYMMVSNLLIILQTKITKSKLNAAPPAGPAAPALTYAPKKAK